MAKKKAKKTVKKRKLDMAEHEVRVKTLGISDRAKRTLIRAVIILVPVVLFIFWLAKTAK